MQIPVMVIKHVVLYVEVLQAIILKFAIKGIRNQSKQHTYQPNQHIHQHNQHTSQHIHQPNQHTSQHTNQHINRHNIYTKLLFLILLRAKIKVQR